MHLAIFSDCIDQTTCNGHPSMRYVSNVLERISEHAWSTTPQVVTLYASKALTDHCAKWASGMLFCRVQTALTASYEEEDSSPRNLTPRSRAAAVRRRSLGSPRLSAWPLYMIENCTHALVLVHSDAGATQRIVLKLFKRVSQLSTLHVQNVPEQHWVAATE